MSKRPKIDPALANALRHWHGMTEAEVKRFKERLASGEPLNLIEQVEAQAIIDRVKRWESEQ